MYMQGGGGCGICVLKLFLVSSWEKCIPYSRQKHADGTKAWVANPLLCQKDFHFLWIYPILTGLNSHTVG